MKRMTPMFLLLAILGTSSPAFGTQGECRPGPQGLACQAENGNLDAQYAYGMALLEGEGVEEDRMAALRWLDLASKGGHSGAKQMLAVMSLSTEPGELCAGKK